ncbi:hypothetical protein AB7849_09450 [Rhodanobacter sp. 115]|uniref:hypothetical protein n=1 Tax=Rhodanobacter sp. FW021-MT20 TaxID=1162282 RepID=UPI0034E4E305
MMLPEGVDLGRGLEAAGKIADALGILFIIALPFAWLAWSRPEVKGGSKQLQEKGDEERSVENESHE